MTKVTLEVGDGEEAVVVRKNGEAWGLAKREAGHRVQMKHVDYKDGWDDVLHLNDFEYRLAPLSPVEELVAVLRAAHVVRGCPARVAEALAAALAAVEAEIAQKKGLQPGPCLECRRVGCTGACIDGGGG